MKHFYALMDDNSVQIIELNSRIENSVKDIFMDASRLFMPDDVEVTPFDGDVLAREGENILYVELSLPDSFNDIPENEGDIDTFDINEDSNPKSVFWYEDGIYYFQIFNRRNLLKDKFILRISGDNSFSKMDDSGFILDKNIQAIYKEDRFYFMSYKSANSIIPLKDYMVLATDDDIAGFSNYGILDIDAETIKEIGNMKTRRLINSIVKSGNIFVFQSISDASKKKLLKKYNVDAKLANGNIILRKNNAANLNRVLEFLNEDIFIGGISSRRYKSNSKKRDD